MSNQKPELILSTTSSFFLGGVRQTFKNAKKFGFKYVEIVPYRWTTVAEIKRLEQEYGVKLAGIHMPIWWKRSFGQKVASGKNLLNKFFALLFIFYLGDATKNPGLALAETFKHSLKYLLFHTTTVMEMGEIFNDIARKYPTVIENVPYRSSYTSFYWDPSMIDKEIRQRGLRVGLVFDPGHFGETIKDLPSSNLLETYKKSTPEIIHISYNSHGIHLLPDSREQEELKKMLRIHPPRFISIETNPMVSVKKAKALLDKIIEEAMQSS